MIIEYESAISSYVGAVMESSELALTSANSGKILVDSMRPI